MTVSAAILVKNEEQFLPDCIESLRGKVDEIVVLDTGSSDATFHIARHAADKAVKSELFDANTKPEDFHFGNARNELLSHLSCDWSLSIDADERLSGTVSFPGCDVGLIEIDDGDISFCGPRLLKLGEVRFVMRVHAMPVPYKEAELVTTCKLRHARPFRRVGNVERNRILLERQLKECDSETQCQSLVNMANFEADVGDIWRAIGLYHAAMSFVTGERLGAYILTMMASAYERARIHHAAAAYATKAIEYEPRRVMARLIRAAHYIRAGRYDDAEKDLRVAESCGTKRLSGEHHSPEQTKWIREQLERCKQSMTSAA